MRSIVSSHTIMPPLFNLDIRMYKICFYVPESHIDAVKNALFEVGAGKIGAYSCCSWQTMGEGQFMPLVESQAYIGAEGELEKIAEYKVEMVCEDELLVQTIAALKKSHPYETPAFQAWKVEII